jgi:alginate O-acetyltransferase complex protein AlgI
MLFTTAAFICLFLPITLVGYFALGHSRPAWAAGWLLAASLFFYGWWMPVFTVLLLGSIAFNFLAGQALMKVRHIGQPDGRQSSARGLLALAIGVDLALLAYFKYANFFIDSVNAVAGTHWVMAHVVLPIGISFYTFTQIAYLVDTWAGKVQEARAVHYGLFVTYFPHLVAGPVLHHAQMMPQFERPEVYRFDAANFHTGLVLLGLGLFKKIVLADGIAPYADAVFAGADAGASPTSAEAWLGAVAYTFQLYFDFSGYSDMAVGLSRMFNISLPFNFDSPYKSRSITEFWRRWHISLSTFLRDYLYVPLGGNRRGAVRRYVNLGLTMVLGGLWHGASWSFVIWGAMHGAYLMVNHGFRALTGWLAWRPALDRSRLFGLLAWALTALAVVAAWVLFRAQTLEGACRVLQSMGRLAPAPVHELLWNLGLSLPVGVGWCCVLAIVSLALPNNNAIGLRLLSVFQRSADLRIALGSAAMALIALLVVINAKRDAVSAFIYFNF